MDETTSMNLLEHNTSVTPVHSMTTVGSYMTSIFGEKKLQIKGSLNLDDESPPKGKILVKWNLNNCRLIRIRVSS